MDLLIEKRKLSEFGGISLPNGENRTQIRQGQLTSFSAFFEHINALDSQRCHWAVLII